MDKFGMTKAQKEYIMSKDFIIFDGFELSMFLNICYIQDVLFGIDDDNFKDIIVNKDNLTETGLKFYDSNASVMYKNFETNYLRQISI